MTECTCPAARGGVYPHLVEHHDGVPDFRPLLAQLEREFLRSIDREAIEV